MSKRLHPPPYRSAEWQEWRRSRLGASDVPIALGISPYATAYELAARKLGLVAPVAESRAMAWGARIEPLALDDYEAEQGVSLLRGETWQDDRWPHLMTTLDARRDRLGVEIKYTTRWRVVPDHVVVQVQAQMAIADLDAVDVVRVGAYGEPSITPIERDREVGDRICDYAEAWWGRYVGRGELPEPDGSPAATAMLDRLRGEEMREADQRQCDLMEQWRTIRRQRDTAERAEADVKAALKASMAECCLLIGPDWHVTWSAVAPRRAVAWQRVAEELRRYVRPGEWDELLAAATTLGEPTTRLTPHWEDEP